MEIKGETDKTEKGEIKQGPKYRVLREKGREVQWTFAFFSTALLKYLFIPLLIFNRLCI